MAIKRAAKSLPVEHTVAAKGAKAPAKRTSAPVKAKTTAGASAPPPPAGPLATAKASVAPVAAVRSAGMPGGFGATAGLRSTSVASRSASDPVTGALAQIEALRRDTQATLDKTKDTGARAKLNDLLDALSDETEVLNRQEITNHTVDLNAAADELEPGILKLQQLQAELAQVAKTIETVAKIADGVSQAISGVKTVLAGFA